MNKTVNTRYGTMEYLDADSVVSRSLAMYGEWAQAELDLLAKIIRPGDVVLDVGAFLGTHTLAFAKMVGTSGAVHSFEPRADIRQILASNVERNRLPQVQIEDCALGDVAGTLKIEAVNTQDNLNFGGLAIEEVAASDNSQTELISLKTLDSYGLTRIDLIKIDAEGMEAKVIIGGINSIRGIQPIVFAECNDLENGWNTLNALRNLDYKVYGFISKAFNSENFLAESHNIFGSAAEVSILGVPSSKQTAVMQVFDLARLPKIDSVDDLSLLLLQKPQYAEEAWGRSAAGAVLGLNFTTPASRQLQVRADELETDRNSLLANLAAAKVDLENARAQVDASLAEAVKLRAQLEELQVFRQTSLVYRWRQLVEQIR